LTVFDTRGLEFIKELAELYFVEKRRPRDTARDFRARSRTRGASQPESRAGAAY